MKRLLALGIVAALTGCADWPPAPPTLSTLAQAGLNSYQAHAFDGGYFATDLKGQTYAYAWLDRQDEFEVQLWLCSPLGCTQTDRYGQNALHAALTTCQEIAGDVCTVTMEGARRR